MLYATEGVNSDDDFQKAMIGVASVWSVPQISGSIVLDLTKIKQVRREPVCLCLLYTLPPRHY